MTSDLSYRLRDFVGSVEPVTVDEVRRRVHATSASSWEPGPGNGWSRPRRWMSAAAIVVIITGAVALALIGPWGSPSTSDGFAPRGHALSLSAVRLVADTSAAALDSGTAHMNITQSVGGSPVNRFSTEVTFSGHNLDVMVALTTYPPSPPGAPAIGPTTSTSDNRVVDGSAYRQIGGQWYVETGPGASKFLSFPDPRAFVRDISPSAGLVSLGAEESGGIELTHLRARNPAVLGNLGIAGLGSTNDTAFDVWVDGQGVVRRMTIATTGESGVCSSQTTPITVPMHCTYTAETGTVDITFANIGDPETVNVPAGAVPGSWPSS